MADVKVTNWDEYRIECLNSATDYKQKWFSKVFDEKEPIIELAQREIDYVAHCQRIHAHVGPGNWEKIFIICAIVAMEQLSRQGIMFSSPDLADLLRMKSSRYGHKALVKWGLMGIAIRLDSKLERAKNLLADPNLSKGTDESLNDTLTDVVGYCVLADLIIRGIIS